MAYERAVIFDLDGTLIDGSEGVLYQLSMLRQEFGGGPPLTAAEALDIIHHTSGVPVRMLAALLGTEAPDVLGRATDRHGELIAASGHLFKSFDGAETLLEQLQDAGYGIGAFTARDHRMLNEPTFQRLEQYFDMVVSTEDVKRPKPDPEGVHKILGKLSVAPESALLVGDAAADILCAKAAGLHASIGITHGFGSIESLEEAGADYLVNSLPEVWPLLQELPLAA